jgi:hypothetical protein
MRSMDELAMVLAFAPAGQRLEFALEVARQQAQPDRSNPDQFVFRGGPRELALLAAVDEAAATSFLEVSANKGQLHFSQRHIAFMN